MEKSKEFIMKPTAVFCFNISDEMPLKCEPQRIAEEKVRQGLSEQAWEWIRLR